MCLTLNEVLEPPNDGGTTSALHVYLAWALTEVSSDTGRGGVSELSTSKMERQELGQGNVTGREDRQSAQMEKPTREQRKGRAKGRSGR